MKMWETIEDLEYKKIKEVWLVPWENEMDIFRPGLNQTILIRMELADTNAISTT